MFCFTYAKQSSLINTLQRPGVYAQAVQDVKRAFDAYSGEDSECL